MSNLSKIKKRSSRKNTVIIKIGNSKKEKEPKDNKN